MMNQASASMKPIGMGRKTKWIRRIVYFQIIKYRIRIHFSAPVAPFDSAKAIIIVTYTYIHIPHTISVFICLLFHHIIGYFSMKGLYDNKLYPQFSSSNNKKKKANEMKEVEK